MPADTEVQPSPIVTSDAPRSRLSGAQIAQPYAELSRAFDTTSDSLEKVAVPLAEQAANQAVARQRVTLNADGSVNVENPASAPLIFGEAGEAYHRAALAGTVAQYDNALSESFADMHAKHSTDPQAFKAASDAYLNSVVTNAPPMMQAAVKREGLQLQSQHFAAITDRAANLDIANRKATILAQIDNLKDTAIGLARQDGVDTPEFQKVVGKLNAAYDALGSNPLFRIPQEQIDIEKNNTAALLQGESLVAHVDSTFAKNGKAAAQQILQTQVLNNPNLRETDRTRLYTQGLSRLQYLSGDAKATVDANRAIVSEMEKSLADGKLSAEDPAVGMAIQRSQQIGDIESTQRLTAAAAVQQHLRAVNPLPDAMKSEALGVPGASGNAPVNQSIPREGRALLQRIGATESANRYDVRYGGARFFDFSDHPNIAVPITSGPDVGKTSTAAGYYQFLNSTWQAEKQKLGLSDFSPANQDTAAWDLAQTEYKNKTGRDLLGDLKAGKSIDSILPSLSGQWSSLPGGRQPAGYLAPSANGGPGFAAADVQRNPFLLSAYVRTLAADPELRIQSAKQTAASVNKALDNGFLPAASAVAEVNQAAQLYPQKMGPIADEMNGRLIGQKIAQLPEEQRAQLIQFYKDATNGQDAHQINLASAALAQVERQEQNMRDHPLAEAANRGWTQQPLPIDPDKPDSIAPALAQRAQLSARIGALNHTPNPPLLDKDDMPKLQTALQSQGGAQVLGSIAQALKPDEMQTLLKQEPFRNAVTAMSRSGDPVKMNAAYSFMDSLQRQNPLQFDAQFPDGLKDLRAWQSSLAFYPPDVAAKRLLQAYDPAHAAGLQAADKVADKALESVSPAKVVAKFSTGWGPFGTSAGVPVSTEAGIAAGALKADYDKNYRDGFAATGDASAADNFAMEKLRLKYDLSPTNGGRVMAYPPERYYPQIDGSHEWMTQQLDDAVAKQFSVKNTPPNLEEAFAGAVEPTATLMDERSPAERQYNARRALVADETTERDIANGRPPSYQVILQEPNGRWTVMTRGMAQPQFDATTWGFGNENQPQRFRFDPSPFFAARAAEMEQRRATIEQLRPYASVVPAL